MIDATGWWFLALVLMLAVGWYLSYTASRLDRLHHKVIGARAALDVQLVSRGAASVEVASYLDPATAMLLTDAAATAMAFAERDSREDARRDPLDVPEGFEVAQSDLTKVLQLALEEPASSGPASDPFRAEAFEALRTACVRVQLARRFHNEAVAQVSRLRGRPVVRWPHLAGHASNPSMIEFDDALPPGLS